MSRPEVAGMDSEHTVLAVYLVGLCAAFTITYDSTQVGRDEGWWPNEVVPVGT